MGIMKDVKVDVMRREGEKAIAQGRTVFAPRLNMPNGQPGLSGPIADWALMIEAVESTGWRLEHWSVAADKQGRTEAYPLFRRAQPHYGSPTPPAASSVTPPPPPA